MCDGKPGHPTHRDDLIPSEQVKHVSKKKPKYEFLHQYNDYPCKYSRKYHRPMQGKLLKLHWKHVKGLKNYRLDFEKIKIWIIHIKTKHITSVIGDSRWPNHHLNITQLLPGYTYPPKNFVCCIPNAVSQTKRPVDPKEMKQHKINYIRWNEWKHILLHKAVL